MRKTLIAISTAAALLVGGGAASAASSSPSPSTSNPASSTTQLERVAAYTQPSVVYIEITWTGYVYDKFNKMFLNKAKPFTLHFQCTGYVVNPDGYIATAGHCVNPDEVKASFIQAGAQWALNTGYYASKTLTLQDIVNFDDYVVMNSQKKKTPDRQVTAAWGVSAGGVQTGKALPAQVLKYQNFADGDAALLKVDATGLNALPLSKETPEIGEEIVSIGYPANVDLVADQSFDPSFKDGSISSKKTVAQGLSTVYEISAAVSGGMSGGPTVNTNGEVVGFNSFGINSQIETQQFNFVRPVENIEQLIADAGTTNTLSKDTQSFRDGLTAYFNGDRTTAVKKLSSVVQDQPTFQFASDYLDKAKKLPLPPKKSNVGTIIGIVIGLLVLLLVVGLVLFLVMRGRKKKQPVVSAPAPVYAGAPGGAAYPGAPGAYQGAPGGYQGAPAGYQAQRPAGPQYNAPQAPPQAAPAPAPQAPPQAPPAAPAPAAPPAGAAPTGATAAAEPSVDLFCPNCGQKHQPGQKFCPHCGAQL